MQSLLPPAFDMNFPNAGYGFSVQIETNTMDGTEILAGLMHAHFVEQMIGFVDHAGDP